SIASTSSRDASNIPDFCKEFNRCLHHASNYAQCWHELLDSSAETVPLASQRDGRFCAGFKCWRLVMGKPGSVGFLHRPFLTADWNIMRTRKKFAPIMGTFILFPSWERDI